MSRRVKTLTVTDKSLRARALAVQLMGQHGLHGWQFAFNDNVRRAGVCRYPHLGQPGRIELSVHYCERNGEAEVRDTILHEIAHALVGRGHGHGKVWKAKCVEIGARPERCYDSAKVDMPKGKWRATCPGCGQKFHKHRRPRTLTGWNCRKCGKEKGQITWAKVELRERAV